MNKEKGSLSKPGRTLQDLNLCDDFLFGEVMSDERICRRVLEKILEIKIGRITYLDSQVSLNPIHDAHGIRMDVQARDEKGTVFTVEMQGQQKYNESRRSRYYHSLMDADHLLKKGTGYSALPDNYVIFICAFDMFSLGRHIYRFSNICEDDRKTYLDDGQHTIVLNTEGTEDDVDDEMKAFLSYAKESTDENAECADSLLVRDIHEKVQFVKNNQKAGERFMKLELLLNEKQEEGFEQGRAEGLSYAVLKLKDSGMSEEKISQALSISEEEVSRMLQQRDQKETNQA